MVALVQGMKLMPQILISLQKGIKHNMLQTLIATEKNAAYKPKMTVETLDEYCYTKFKSLY